MPVTPGRVVENRQELTTSVGRKSSISPRVCQVAGSRVDQQTTDLGEGRLARGWRLPAPAQHAWQSEHARQLTAQPRPRRLAPPGAQRVPGDAPLGADDAPEVPADQRAGHVLGDDPDRVAAHVETGERAAAGRAEVVIEARRGRKDGIPAQQPEPPCQVHVLQVHEEPLVEAAGLLPRRAAIHHPAAARAKDLRLGVVLTRVPFPHPAVARDAVGAHQIARVVQRVAAVEEQHLAGDRAGPGIRRRGLDQRGQPARLDLGVVVEHHQQLAARRPRTRVAPDGQAAVARQLDELDLGILFGDKGDGTVRGRVIHQDDFGVLARIGLRPQRVEAGRQKTQPVVVRDDDAGERKGVRHQASGTRDQASGVRRQASGVSVRTYSATASCHGRSAIPSAAAAVLARTAWRGGLDGRGQSALRIGVIGRSGLPASRRIVCANSWREQNPALVRW